MSKERDRREDGTGAPGDPRVRVDGNLLPTGAQREQFIIERVLGAHEFGVTYLARGVSSPVRRVVKEYLPTPWGRRLPDGTVGPHTRADADNYCRGLHSFLGEARMLERCEHRNLVRVHRVFEAQGTGYVVMDYVEGPTLAEELSGDPTGTLPEERVRTLLDGLTAGLARAHAAGLLHLDIEPANVILREDGSPVLVGFATVRESMERELREDPEQPLRQSPYWPIERHDGRRRGPWTDIYSLGMTAYTALVGRPRSSESGLRVSRAADGSLPGRVQRRRTPTRPLRVGRADGSLPGEAEPGPRGWLPRLLGGKQAADKSLPAETALQEIGGDIGAAVKAALAVMPEDRPRDVEEWRALLGVSTRGGGSPVNGWQPDVAGARRDWEQMGSGAGAPSRERGGSVVVHGARFGPDDADAQGRSRRWTRAAAGEDLVDFWAVRPDRGGALRPGARLKEPEIQDVLLGLGDPRSEFTIGALPQGTQLEEFEIEGVLGVGGFGITYLARDTRRGARVAIKAYLPLDKGSGPNDTGPAVAVRMADPAGTVHLLDNGQYWSGFTGFQEEANALAELAHRNVVRVHRVFEVGHTAFLAMELVEGRSLADELEVEGPLAEPQVRRILGGLTDGLSAVHAAGLLHLDIKPANVMLREGDDEPVLIDFGAARQRTGWRSAWHTPRRSCPMPSMLTPGYAAIEQYGQYSWGPWTDVYGLGALAYAALTGRVPQDALTRRRHDALPPLESPQPASPALATAVAAALSVDRSGRPKSLDEWRMLLGA